MTSHAARAQQLLVHVVDVFRDYLQLQGPHADSAVAGTAVVNLRAPDGMWERDYVQELVRNVEHVLLDMSVSEACRTRFRNAPIVIWNSTVVSLREFRRVVRILRPNVVIHLADEWGTHNDETRWYPLVPLVLRQHHFPWYTQYSNSRIIPLGYMAGMLDRLDSTSPTFCALVRPPEARKYSWSFVGAMKSDRHELMREFATLTPHALFTNGGVAPRKMRDLYLDSIFVPCGRGNVRLDCFRLYEASLCGAIPVVVGSDAEIREAFHYERTPSWVFAESWSEAVVKCRVLLAHPVELGRMQRAVVEWWRGEITQLQALIASHVVRRQA